MKIFRLLLTLCVLLLNIFCAFSHLVDGYRGYGGVIYYCYTNSTTTQYAYAISCDANVTNVSIPMYLDWNGDSRTVVTSIRDSVFRNCVSLTTVNIDMGCSVCTAVGIGKRAFENCTNLQSVSFHDYSIDYSLGKFVFKNCPRLKSITIGNSVTSFCGDSAFVGSSISSPIYNAQHFFHLPTSKSGIYTIPSGITTIGKYAFQDCHNISNIVLPNTLTTIEDYAFKNCTGLTSINIPSSVQGIASNAFSGCSNLRSVNASGSTDDMTWSLQNGNLVINCTGRITSTPWSAFSSFIQNVQASGSDGSISWSLNNGILIVTGLNSQFQSDSYAPWYKLKSYVNGITFESGNDTIVAKAFQNYTNLQSITLSSSVNTIGSKAFYGCTSLVSVLGGDGLLDVAVDAFPESACHVENYIKYIGRYLMEATSKNFPSYAIKDDTKVIGTNAFKDCTRLTTITIPDSVQRINASAFSGCTRLATVTGMSNVTYVGDYCFSKCSALSSINIPSSIIYIGNSAFFDCSLLSNTGTIFSNMHTLEYIGSYAFYNCEALPIRNLSFGNSLKEIGDKAFGRCKIVSVEIPYNVSYIGSQAFVLQTLKHIQWNAKNCKIETYKNAPFVDYDRYDGYKTCPVESIEFGSSVEVIPYALCYGMEKLTSVTIPASVDSICFAFNSTNNKLDTIIWNAKNCKSMLYSSPLGNIENQIKSFVIGEHVESIPDYLCAEMKNVAPISIPNSVKHIGRAAFRGSNVNKLSTNIEDIDVAAFKECSGLPRSLTMPTKLKTIGDSAFYYCYPTSVIFPSSLRHLGKYIFAAEFGMSSGIRRMTCYSSIVPSITNKTFRGVSTDAIVYVKDSVAFDYMLDTNWGLFDIRSITANNVSTTGISIVPGDEEVTITWPQVNNASYYEIEVTKSGELVATLRFGADGKLLGIAYAPVKNAASSTNSTGFSYTIIGLEYATMYTFSVVAKSNTNTILSNESGTFATNGLSFTVSCSGDNCSFLGEGMYSYGEQAVVTAIPSDGYHFVQWSDGNTDNPRAISIWSDFTLSAQTEKNTYLVNATCENGVITGTGEYQHGAYVSVEVIPNKGYKFDKWDDGSKHNPYCFIVTQDVSLIGYVIPINNAITDVVNIDAYSKTIHDGQLLIIRNGKRYTITGIEL